MSGHGYRADRHHQAYKQSARIAEEELRGVPIPGQEPNERSRQQDGQNGSEPEVRGALVTQRKNKGIEEKHSVGDESNTDHEAIEPVNEVHGVHHHDNRQHGKNQRKSRRKQRQTADR